MLARLDADTRFLHRDADERWYELLDHAVTERDYTRQLALTYGFEAPIEAALNYTPGLKAWIDVRRRFRAGLLAQDLLALGIKPAAIARLPQYEPMEPFALAVEALGWMYAIERPTELHDRIRAHVVARGIATARATAYLATGADHRARWDELVDALEHAAGDRRMVDELVAAARTAFRCMIDWYRREHLAYARGA